ncbi:MAG: sensor histidine kinase [Actinomycetota bacterium]|nr:sensor histidine kinase [Actinomycetota bacterium]
MVLRPFHPVIVAVFAAAAVTAISAVGPFALAYRSLTLHVAIETAAALVAALAAFLVFGRFQQQGRLGHLVLAAALATFAITNFVLSVVPSITGAAPGRFWTWAPLVVRLVATAALAVSPFLLGYVLDNRRRASLLGFAGIATVFVLVAVGVGTAAPLLPVGVDPADSPRISDWPNDAALVLLTGHLVAAMLFAAGAVGFGVEGARARDAFMRWLGLGCVAGAFAHANYFVFPSLYSAWITTGDFLRMAFYALVVVGAVREIAAYQHERARTAVIEERRRLARDMHDGLAQELAFLLTQTRLLAIRRPDTPGLAEIEAAAQRALDESRLAIAALTRPGYEPLEAAVAAAAEEVAGRAGVHVRFRLTDGIEVGPEVRDAMVRIVREAVTNAARHGKPGEVTVELSNGKGIQLCVIDDGVGFEPAKANGTRVGFGLTSMRERAEALGGEFRIESRPGEGTRVEVNVP